VLAMSLGFPTLLDARGSKNCDWMRGGVQRRGSRTGSVCSPGLNP
jgi:hypothetical protein